MALWNFDPFPRGKRDAKTLEFLLYDIRFISVRFGLVVDELFFEEEEEKAALIEFDSELL